MFEFVKVMYGTRQFVPFFWTMALERPVAAFHANKPNIASCGFSAMDSGIWTFIPLPYMTNYTDLCPFNCHLKNSSLSINVGNII